MTEPLSSQVLALREPLDVYAHAEAKLDTAQRRLRAARSALDAYRENLGNGHEEANDTVLHTLSEAVDARRGEQRGLARQRDEAASRVRSLLAEAAAEEGFGGRISVSGETTRPETQVSSETSSQSPPESPEGLPEEEAQDSNEVQAPDPPAMTVEDAAPVEPPESDDPSSPTEDSPAEDPEEEISFEALLGDDELVGDDPAPVDEAEAEPSVEQMAAEAPDDSPTEPGDTPAEGAVEESAPDEDAFPVADEDEDLWGSLLTKEGEEGSFQSEAVT